MPGTRRKLSDHPRNRKPRAISSSDIGAASSAFWAAFGACTSYALWGRLGFALGAAALAVIAVLLRRQLLPAMQELGGQIEANTDGAIRRFRRAHAMALLVNLAQLVVIVWGTIQLSRPA